MEWITGIITAIVMLASFLGLFFFVLSGWTALTTNGKERRDNILWALGAATFAFLSFAVLSALGTAPTEVLAPIVFTLGGIASWVTLLGVYGSFASKDQDRLGNIYLVLMGIAVLAVCLIALYLMGYY